MRNHIGNAMSNERSNRDLFSVRNILPGYREVNHWIARVEPSSTFAMSVFSDTKLHIWHVKVATMRNHIGNAMSNERCDQDLFSVRNLFVAGLLPGYRDVNHRVARVEPSSTFVMSGAPAEIHIHTTNIIISRTCLQVSNWPVSVLEACFSISGSSSNWTTFHSIRRQYTHLKD